MLSSEAANPNTIEAVVTAFSVLTKGTNFLRLLGGLWVTVWIALVSVIFSILLGIRHIFGNYLSCFHNHKHHHQNIIY